MNESYPSNEREAHPRLYQVGTVPYSDGERRVVVTELINEQFVGTSEIIDEGKAQERLAYSGATPIESLTLTDEVWTRQRAVDGVVATFGETHRDYIENTMFRRPEI